MCGQTCLGLVIDEGIFHFESAFKFKLLDYRLSLVTYYFFSLPSRLGSLVISTGLSFAWGVDFHSFVMYNSSINL